MSRSISLPFSLLRCAASHTDAPVVRSQNANVDGSKALAGMLLAAVLAALLVVADQVIETWANGHLLLVWVALWTVAFAALAVLAPPLRQLANILAAGTARWMKARAARRADEALWNHAQGDSRIMSDIQVAMSRGSDEG